MDVAGLISIKLEWGGVGPPLLLELGESASFNVMGSVSIKLGWWGVGASALRMMPGAVKG